PFGKRLGLLGTIIGAIDLDDLQLARRMFKLPSLGQLFRVERALPGLEGPASDADPYSAARCHGPLRGAVIPLLPLSLSIGARAVPLGNGPYRTVLPSRLPPV